MPHVLALTTSTPSSWSDLDSMFPNDATAVPPRQSPRPKPVAENQPAASKPGANRIPIPALPNAAPRYTLRPTRVAKNSRELMMFMISMVEKAMAFKADDI